MSETSPEVPMNTNERLENRAGRAVQFRVAQALVDVIGKDKLTPDTFKKLQKPFDIGMDSFSAEQEHVARIATGRLIGLMAFIAADGDQQKVEELIGDDEPGYTDEVVSPIYATELENMLERSKQR